MDKAVRDKLGEINNEDNREPEQQEDNLDGDMDDGINNG